MTHSCPTRRSADLPNCSTAQLVVALRPLHDHATIRRVVVSTYQSVSGAGNDGVTELERQTKAIFVNDAIEKHKFTKQIAFIDMGDDVEGDLLEKHKFTKQIAFNVIPHIDVFLDDGYTKEEWKMMAETKKILDPKIKLTATCVRVPVFIGHSEAVNIEFENPISADEAREILSVAPGVQVLDRREDGGSLKPMD